MLIDKKSVIGIVIIGRNEGVRLQRCIESVRKVTEIFVYVDSGSTDDSVEYAKSMGAEIILLDNKLPFSAGRARNEGFFFLCGKYEKITYVQFLDGDCELIPNWVEFGTGFLNNHEDFVIAAGQRKERYPEKSIYNFLCDVEWNTPIGETSACGGDFIIRKEAFISVNGFNSTVIAGEEPDLCYRLKKNNGRVQRLDHLMTLHDAAITSFLQWWHRTTRTGHAFAQGYDLHKQDRTGYYKRENIRIVFWGLVLPLTIIFLSLFVEEVFFLLITMYLIRFIKIIYNLKNRGWGIMGTALYSFFTVIGSFPELLGLMKYYVRKTTRSQFKIIEYN